MKIEKLALELALLIFVSSCNNNHSNSLEQFKGMWRLDKYEAFDLTTATWHDAPKRMG